MPMFVCANPSNEIPDFEASCEYLKFGSNEIRKNSKLVWNSVSQKLTITGDGIQNDSGELTRTNVDGSDRTVFMGLEKSLSDYSKHINMTFRESFFTLRNKTERIRTFRFNVPQVGNKGSISSNNISDINGQVFVNMSFFATSCTFTGI